METMTVDQFFLIAGICVTIFAVLVLWACREDIARLGQRIAGRYVERRSVNRSAPSRPPSYVKRPGLVAPTRSSFRTSHQEAEAEAPPEAPPEAGRGLILLHENALQEKIAHEREQAMIDLLAIIQQAGGTIPPGKASGIKAAAFGVSGGRALQRLNAAIDAATAPLPPAEPAPPPPRQVPIANGTQGYIELPARRP